MPGALKKIKMEETNMARKKRLIPFSMLPASWGLKGKTRQTAEAEYYYEGDELEYEILRINSKSEEEYAQMKLDYDLEKGNIATYEYTKQTANLKKDPWVDVKSVDVNANNPKEGSMELDWNDEFVKMLQSSGYVGKSDEDVVNKWFNDVCRTVLLQEAEDMDFGLKDEDQEVIRIADYDKPDERRN